jgi:hypothetical protein
MATIQEPFDLSTIFQEEDLDFGLLDEGNSSGTVESSSSELGGGTVGTSITGLPLPARRWVHVLRYVVFCFLVVTTVLVGFQSFRLSSQQQQTELEQAVSCLLGELGNWSIIIYFG